MRSSRARCLLRGAVAGLALVAIPSLGGCGRNEMVLDSRMKLEGSMQMQGPIQMQLAGPSVTYSGTYVSEAMFERIKVGTTTGEWLRAVVGAPDSETALSDGTSIWRWCYEPESEQLSPFSLWSSEGEQEPTVRRSLVVVQLKDGIVIERFRD